jgi:tetratricopeptide (TPR) repeat protein
VDGPARLLDLLAEKRRLVSCLALLWVRRPGLARPLAAVVRRIASGDPRPAVPSTPGRFLRWWRSRGRALDRATAFNLRGLLLLGEGRAAEAEAEFEAALALDPDLPAAAYNLSVALEEAGTEGDPAEPLRRHAEVASDPVRSRLLLGEFLERTDRPEEAEAEYRGLLEDDPMNGDAAHALGRLLLEGGKAEEALEPLRRAVAARPGEPGPLVSLGLAHLEAGRPAEAAPLFRAAVESTEGDPREEARFLLHVAFRDAEDHERALETLDAVPDRFLRRNEPMMEEAALYLEERNRWDRARRLQERLRELRARRGEL